MLPLAVAQPPTQAPISSRADHNEHAAGKCAGYSSTLASLKGSPGSREAKEETKISYCYVKVEIVSSIGSLSSKTCGLKRGECNLQLSNVEF